MKMSNALWPRRRQDIRLAEIPDGQVIFAIGDIHGHLDLAKALLRSIVEDFSTQQPARPIVIGLGDYVDRGPNSRAVLDLIMRIHAFPKIESYFLRGNHEQVMIDFLLDPEWGPDWARFGGRETLASYGVVCPNSDDPAAWEEARQAFASALPKDQWYFLNDMPLHCSFGDYFFVHAGAEPGVPLDQQSPRQMLWIREPFLTDRRKFEKLVVHGHTPALEPHFDDRRIGLDTGAYKGGGLTALRLEGRSRRILRSFRTTAGKIEVTHSDVVA